MPRRASPVDLAYLVSSGFRAPDRPNHDGVDWAAPLGAPLYAPADSVVVQGADRAEGSVRGYSNWVWGRTPDGFDWCLGHMPHDSIRVKAGDRVTAGQQVATVGGEGDCVPPGAAHAHLSVYLGPLAEGNAIDPLAWIEAGQTITKEEEPMADTLFADVSEWQPPVDDRYPYPVLSIRSNDGTHEDRNFAANYRWCVKAVEDGRLACFVVYFYWRSNWQDCVLTMKRMVAAQGGPHPKMIAMIDAEAGGNPNGDQSQGLNNAYNALAAWLGDKRRVIGYGNAYDLDRMWPTKPSGLRVVAAGYGRNPNYPGQIAHQYTDGQVGAGALPAGAPPFGNCDMNSADGLDPQQFAALCGAGEEKLIVNPLSVEEQRQLYQWAQYIYQQLQPWPQLGQNPQGEDLTLIDAVAAIKNEVSKP